MISAASETPTPTPMAPPRGSRPLGSGARTFSVVRRSVERVLRSRHDVSPAASGPEALAHLAEDDAYDVVLCDLMMPEMPGWQLFDELERRAELTGTGHAGLTWPVGAGWS